MPQRVMGKNKMINSGEKYILVLNPETKLLQEALGRVEQQAEESSIIWSISMSLEKDLHQQKDEKFGSRSHVVKRDLMVVESSFLKRVKT